MLLRDHAEQIAESAEVKTGIGIDVILPIVIEFLPLVLQELSGCLGTSQTASDFLQDHYDQDSKSFDPHLVARMRPFARRSARKHGQVGLSRFELDAISEATLERGLLQGEPSLRSGISEAMS